MSNMIKLKPKFEISALTKSEEDIVNEVARRVAARLQQENNKAQMVDQLAERIMKRLTK